MRIIDIYTNLVATSSGGGVFLYIRTIVFGWRVLRPSVFLSLPKIILIFGVWLKRNNGSNSKINFKVFWGSRCWWFWWVLLRDFHCKNVLNWEWRDCSFHIWILSIGIRVCGSGRCRPRSSVRVSPDGDCVWTFRWTFRLHFVSLHFPALSLSSNLSTRKLGGNKKNE